ncbi:MAG: thermonuclease family protein [Vicinamibacteria bacterium]|nr:thermonuclease family protein [Vicinamibacteria bacterium]
MIAIGVLSAALLAAAAALPAPFEAIVAGVSDGDSVVVIHEGGPLPIRLDGIDAPESGQPWARKARDRAADLMRGRTVRVLPRDRDTKYDRLVARIEVGGRDVNETLVAEGLAWHYVRFSSDPRLAAAEQAARAAKRGLWADPKPIAPWDWRHRTSRGADAAAALGLGGAAAAGPAEGTGGATAAGALHGNVNSLVYHEPGCRYYWCARCTRTFASAADAARAGFRPAGCCH